MKIRVSIKIFLIVIFLININLIKGQSFHKQSSDIFKSQIIEGDFDLDLVINAYSNDTTFILDSVKKYLEISDRNYIQKKTHRRNIDLQFRYIYVSDQISRIQCYDRGRINYSDVKSNDSILQKLFIETIALEKPDFFKNQIYQETFGLLLIHSVVTPKTNFFMKNFHVYTEEFNNDFKNNRMIQQMLDFYLKFEFNKQYFGTEYGFSSLKHRSKLLPKIPKKKLRKILKNLNIENATID